MRRLYPALALIGTAFVAGCDGAPLQGRTDGPVAYTKSTYTSSYGKPAAAGPTPALAQPGAMSMDEIRRSAPGLARAIEANPSNAEIEARLKGKDLTQMTEDEIGLMSLAMARDICGVAPDARIDASTQCNLAP